MYIKGLHMKPLAVTQKHFPDNIINNGHKLVLYCHIRNYSRSSLKPC